MARVRKGNATTSYFLCDLQPLHARTISTAREVSLEDRARLPANEEEMGLDHYRGRSWEAGSMAPQHDAALGCGAPLLHSGNASAVKQNFWVDLPRTRSANSRPALQMTGSVLTWGKSKAAQGLNTNGK